MTPVFSIFRPIGFLFAITEEITAFPIAIRCGIGYNIGNENKAGFNMLKRILTFTLVVAILALSSCRVVEVIDHGTTAPQETTAPEVTTAPEKDYVLPDYEKLNPSSYVSVGEIDFEPIAKLVFEGAPYNIALSFYGDMKKFPALEDVTRPAQSGDCVKIDYCGKLNGVAFSGGTATNVALFISDYKNGYIPGFTEGIIGHAVGETFDVDVTFPENYHAADLAGKAVVFTMTLHNIYDMSLTDEQVAQFQGNMYQTYAEWLVDEELAITEELLFEALLKATTTNTPLPAETYLYYYEQTVDYYQLVANYYGIPYNTLLSYYGLSETIILQQSLNQATYNMALLVLMEQNELSWTDEEFTQKYDSLVTKYLESNKDAPHEDAVKYADGMKNQIALDLAEEKVLIWSFGMIFPSDEE